MRMWDICYTVDMKVLDFKKRKYAFNHCDCTDLLLLNMCYLSNVICYLPFHVEFLYICRKTLFYKFMKFSKPKSDYNSKNIIYVIKISIWRYRQKKIEEQLFSIFKILQMYLNIMIQHHLYIWILGASLNSWFAYLDVLWLLIYAQIWSTKWSFY